MIDYKIRNRANKVVQNYQWGGNFSNKQRTAAARAKWGKGAYFDGESYVYLDGADNEQKMAVGDAQAPNVGEFLNNRNPFFSAGRREFNTQQKYAEGTGKEWRQMSAQERANYNLAANSGGDITFTHGVNDAGETVNTFTQNGQTFNEGSDEYNELQNSANELKKEQRGITANTAAQIADVAFGIANQAIDSTSKIDQQSSFGSGLKTGMQATGKIASKIDPRVGAAVEALNTTANAIDNIFEQKSDSFEVDDYLASQQGGSYRGIINQAMDAENSVGTYGGLFSNGARRRANKAIAKAKRNMSALNAVNQVAQQQQGLVSQMGDQASNAFAFQLTGGYDQKNMRVAKGGGVLREEFVPIFPDNMIIPKKITPGEFLNGGVLKEVINPDAGGIVDFVPEKLDEWQPVLVVSFKPGGRIEKALDAPETEETEQKSVIPEGSLHKDKHHMENTEGMTKKGIPVVDDDSKQQAEIERNEIIFTKEVTKKLEELYKVYYDENSSAKEKDEAAIDAGKLLTKEIMLNTDDRTGLIDTLKKGGTIKASTEKTPADGVVVSKPPIVEDKPLWLMDMTDKKPSYKEWVKDVNPDYLSDNYDLEKAFEVLPYGDLQRWKKVIGTPLENQLPVESWHLPSVWFDRDNDVGIFLKKGQTVEENPELQYEFDAYNSSPEMQRTWKMVYDPEEGRWMYYRR